MAYSIKTLAGYMLKQGKTLGILGREVTTSTQKSHGFLLSWCQARPTVKFQGIFAISTSQIWELRSPPAELCTQHYDTIPALLLAIGLSPLR